MQSKIRFGMILSVIGLAMLGIFLIGTPNAAAQGPKPGSVRSPRANAGTAFTYQGQLQSNGTPVNGSCDLAFRLYDAASGGNLIGTPLTPTVSVANGLFTTLLDFGANVITGDARWLDVQVRCPSGNGSFSPMSARQVLTPAPMALALPGMYTQQNGTSPNVIGGYSGNVISPTVVGGTIAGGGTYGTENKVWANYATVSGGNANVAGGFSSFIGGGNFNATSNWFATVGGGNNNAASGLYATIGGGTVNNASGGGSFVGGGGYNGINFFGNKALANASTIAGGYGNTIPVTGTYAFIGGGRNNTASGENATVGGGEGNIASGDFYATVGGGYKNTASRQSATVGGGYINTANAFWSTIGGGYSNTVSANTATIGGGGFNTASGTGSFVGGGGLDGTFSSGNQALANASSIVGGFGNVISSTGKYAAVGGGNHNTASNQSATVSGGSHNTASGVGSFIGGGGYDGFSTAGNQASADVGTIGGGLGNTILITGTYDAIGGGYYNTASGIASTVGGGNGNTASFDAATVGGGASNTASGNAATVAGGVGNIASGDTATVAGGLSNSARNTYDTVGGGGANFASGGSATISGGINNTASNQFATVGGGYANTASGNAATIPGGYYNSATMTYTLAAGHRAQAVNQGAFVWADSTNADFASTGNDQFLVRANGGVGISTNAPAAQLHVSSSGGDSMPQMRIDQMNLNDATRLRMTVGGNVSQRWDVAATSAYLTFYSGLAGNVLTMMPNDPTNYMLMGNGARLTIGGQWTNNSDRNIKANFQSVDNRTVLSQVANLPITSWNYKTEGSAIRHIGPMAQDFYAAFGLGNDDKSIGTVDEGGVALAAIQGLNQVVQDKDAQIAAQQKQIDSLIARVDALEKNPLGNNSGVNITFDLNGFVIGALLIGAVMLYHTRKEK